MTSNYQRINLLFSIWVNSQEYVHNQKKRNQKKSILATDIFKTKIFKQTEV